MRDGIARFVKQGPEKLLLQVHKNIGTGSKTCPYYNYNASKVCEAALLHRRVHQILVDHILEADMRVAM